MQDTCVCPICGDKLRSIKRKHQIINLNPAICYTEKLCVKHISHFIQFFVDIEFGSVDMINISISTNRQKIARINFYMNESRIIMPSKLGNEIIIAKSIEPDFPDLINLKEKFKLYTVFS